MFLVLRLAIFLIAIIAITVVGSANASSSSSSSSSDITLSTPIAVDTSGNQKLDIHVDEVIAFSSVISNHSGVEKRFTYLVSVFNQNNQVEVQDLSADIGPNQEFTVSQSWILK